MDRKSTILSLSLKKADGEALSRSSVNNQTSSANSIPSSPKESLKTQRVADNTDQDPDSDAFKSIAVPSNESVPSGFTEAFKSQNEAVSGALNADLSTASDVNTVLENSQLEAEDFLDMKNTSEYLSVHESVKENKKIDDITYEISDSTNVALLDPHNNGAHVAIGTSNIAGLTENVEENGDGHVDQQSENRVSCSGEQEGKEKGENVSTPSEAARSKTESEADDRLNKTDDKSAVAADAELSVGETEKLETIENSKNMLNEKSKKSKTGCKEITFKACRAERIDRCTPVKPKPSLKSSLKSVLTVPAEKCYKADLFSSRRRPSPRSSSSVCRRPDTSRCRHRSIHLSHTSACSPERSNKPSPCSRRRPASQHQLTARGGCRSRDKMLPRQRCCGSNHQRCQPKPERPLTYGGCSPQLPQCQNYLHPSRPFSQPARYDPPDTSRCSCKTPLPPNYESRCNVTACDYNGRNSRSDLLKGSQTTCCARSAATAADKNRKCQFRSLRPSDLLPDKYLMLRRCRDEVDDMKFYNPENGTRVSSGASIGAPEVSTRLSRRALWASCKRVKDSKTEFVGI